MPRKLRNSRQWLKCNRTLRRFSTSNLWLKAFPTSDCYNSKERPTTTDRGGANLNVTFPHSHLNQLLTSVVERQTDVSVTRSIQLLC